MIVSGRSVSGFYVHLVRDDSAAHTDAIPSLTVYRLQVNTGNYDKLASSYY